MPEIYTYKDRGVIKIERRCKSIRKTQISKEGRDPMLVLARHYNEKVCIHLPDGRKVVITVAEIRGGTEFKPRVRLGFEADKDIRINRVEVDERIAIEGERSK